MNKVESKAHAAVSTRRRLEREGRAFKARAPCVGNSIPALARVRRCHKRRENKCTREQFGVKILTAVTAFEGGI